MLRRSCARPRLTSRAPRRAAPLGTPGAGDRASQERQALAASQMTWTRRQPARPVRPAAHGADSSCLTSTAQSRGSTCGTRTGTRRSTRFRSATPPLWTWSLCGISSAWCATLVTSLPSPRSGAKMSQTRHCGMPSASTMALSSPHQEVQAANSSRADRRAAAAPAWSSRRPQCAQAEVCRGTKTCSCSCWLSASRWACRRSSSSMMTHTTCAKL
mmetsp:Transcript_45372/g.117430  ORF Transcript_45372/g.117430 Transcript_45372/m.117430 type:complete len:215 (-) Transcript_45372:500-1144(-)